MPMTHIFISYCRRDKDAAEELVSLLHSEGWSVWYDNEIAAGHRFRTDIEAELEAARAVIVLWSTDAVESSWVNAEAEEAARLAKVVPIRLDGCRIPLTMRSIQTIDFTGWMGDPTASCWLALRDIVIRLAGPPSGQIEAKAFDFIVGSGTEATHASISAAVEAAAPGQSIKIQPGTYSENLLIDRQINLMGADRDTVILDGGKATAVLLLNSEASLQGLSIRADTSTGVGVVNVDAGNLTLRDVSISTPGNGVCIRAISRARISMRNCTTEGGGYGCLGAFQSSLSLNGCTLSRHRRHGILGDGGCDVSIRNSRIAVSDGCGILIESRSSVTVRSTVLVGHKTVGVEVRAESTGDVRYCEFRENGQGIRAGGTRTAVLAESNRIESCEYCCIHVHDRATLVAKRNELTKSHGGVIVFEAGRIELVENEVTHNEGHGVEVRQGGTAQLTRNHLFQNSGQGLRCNSGATVSSFADYVALSGDHGVVCIGAKLTLDEATIADSHAFGLLAIDEADVQARRILVDGSVQTGAEVRHASLLADDIIIRGSGEHGLWVSEKGTLTFLNSEITLSALSAMRVESDLPVSITKCLIRESRDFGIHLLKDSVASLNANIISANELAGICIEEGAKPEIVGNLIENNKAEGVRIRQKGGGSIRHNVIRKNTLPVAIEVSKEDLETIIDGITDDPANFLYQ